MSAQFSIRVHGMTNADRMATDKVRKFALCGGPGDSVRRGTRADARHGARTARSVLTGAGFPDFALPMRWRTTA